MMASTSNALGLMGAIGKRQNANGSEHFNSDGSNAPSKCCDGKLFKVGRSNTGLTFYVKTSDGKVRKMNQRMPQERVSEILAYLYRNNYQRIDGGQIHRSKIQVKAA